VSGDFLFGVTVGLLLGIVLLFTVALLMQRSKRSREKSEQ
jgi:NhaP-type Na+/H+ or K+/H+ antiporter